MEKKEIKMVINILKEHVDENEDLITENSLSKQDIDNIKCESAACIKAISLLKKALEEEVK